MGILVCIKFCRRDSGYSYFFDEKPRKFEVSWSVRYVWWKGVVLGKVDGGHVCKDEVTPLRIGELLNEGVAVG